MMEHLAIVRLDRDGQADELVHLASNAEIGLTIFERGAEPTSVDPYTIRVAAEAIVGEDKVPTEVLLMLLGAYGEAPAPTRPECSCDRLRGCPACFASAKDLIGFTVRSHNHGSVFTVTETGEKNGYPYVADPNFWAMLDDVTVIAPPDEEKTR
jgi:hypothetical protein